MQSCGGCLRGVGDGGKGGSVGKVYRRLVGAGGEC